MTSDNTKYSSIIVSGEDEDDIVIHAGTRGAHGGRTAAPDETEDAAADEDAGARVGETGSEGDEPAEEGSGGSEESGRDRYRETTEEDIRNTSMPTIQKVIIVVALCLLVGFTIYYNFLR